MRQRSSLADKIEGFQHEQHKQERRSTLNANQRKQQRLQLDHPHTYRMILLKFGLCFFLSCFTGLAILHTIPRPHALDGRHSMIRTVQEAKTHSSVNDFNAHAHSSEHSEKIDYRTETHNTQCPFYGCPIVASEVTALGDITVQSDAISQHHILLTHKSNRKIPAPVNQDRAVLINPFSPVEVEIRDHQGSYEPRNNFLMGIFDGHDSAGGAVAEFAMTEIPLRLANKLNRAVSTQQNGPMFNSTVGQNKVKSALIQAHNEVDEALPSNQAMAGGCTANVILRLGSTLYMSNTGDSYSYLVTYTPPIDGLKFDNNTEPTGTGDLQPHLQGSIIIHHENIKHKPHLPIEKLRIESHGGRIHIPPTYPMGSRVIVKSSVHNEDVGLAMSRSIGDSEWTKVGVIPVPDIETVDLIELFAKMGENSKLFAVVASDGLFDNRKVEFVTKHLASAMFESPASGHEKEAEQDGARNMLENVKRLIAASSPLKADWYRDDISFVAVIVEL
ncbi:hypothetical protein HJC23_011439 [Cyclotella cryptica]|uniref:protein-serine/threonine phosphatase n=1 Tax=Cyclotella cryptica TaxID=29204 RepID=A0ABD3P2Y6_9STRA|eukprot:CCRYP_018208-RA/>CCRYP_018208-RA protein AED:0.00 eAED:0.00 QI:65/-1/1/1/-1/1/1/177/501